MAAEFTIEVLEGGAIRIETGDLGGIHHASADDFIKTLEKLAGGEVEVKKKAKSLKQKQHKHVHVHDHGHDHGHHHH
jgi:hypothetical protein